MDAHEVVDPRPVLTVIGNDGVRWACDRCNETVFARGEKWQHFDKSLNLQEVR